ncbi:Glycosyl transferase family 2 [uncultured archaeon]|nr:Glycosyl transferase family 2 [uncultured archaeon]
MIKFNLEVKLPEVLSLRNTNRYLVEGWIFHSSRIKNLSIFIDKKRYNADTIEMFRPDIGNQYAESIFSFFSGFSIPVILNPVQKYQEHEIILNAEFRDGQKFTYQIGTLKLEPWKSKNREFILPQNVTENELLVICMATYNPKELRFRRQIESIIHQDYTNWICIVCDDGSEESRKKYMRKILAQDPRFFFIENPENVGFYHNFERCLELVPSRAKYVALADQDDYWYPNKLSECLSKLVGKTQLVYCDMRIVHENGTVISETYWKNRKNYYKREDLDLLVIANTVTGAASVFRASLLKKVLPFPPRYGGVFHDQWIGIIASASGGIDYVNTALYDYIQSGENVIGHCDFGQATIKDFLRIDSLLGSYRQKNLPFLMRIKSLMYNILLLSKELYEYNHMHVKHISTLIESASVRNINNIFILHIRRPLSVFGLLKMRTKIVIREETTNNIELSLLFSRFLNFIYPFCIPILSRVMIRRAIKQKEEGINQTNNIKYLFGLADHIDLADFKRKFSGRQFSIVQKKQDINFLLSRIDPANFFGGYIAMFNFAKKFSDIGYSVRIILTDQKEIIESELQKVQNHDPYLKNFLTKAEYLPCFSSEQIVPISKDDIFVATSWWTAHIAHEAVLKTNHSKFIYLAQDYEPIFYEHGAYRVLADQSYRFNYFPFFSTDILQRYFIESGIVDKKKAGVYFKNPVLDFDLTHNDLQKRKGKKKLLFYARPQPNNARNLYPMGCLAIDRAREIGYFKDDEWEIIAIGGDIGEQTLPSGIKIKHIGKFDMKKYKSLLPQHDLGLALMDSPHPSLLPIEMASAGLLVVTNTYGIKNQEYFSTISKNIKAVPPDPESLANALIELSEKVNNLNGRIEGSKVNWPHDWNEALPLAAIDEAIKSVVKSKDLFREVDFNEKKNIC